MGYSGLTHQVGTFSGPADNLHTRGILQVVYIGDSTVAWSSSLHSIGSGSSVYGSVLEEFPEGHVDHRYVGQRWERAPLLVQI